MRVIEYLNTRGNSLETLKADLGIKVKEYPEENLYILNYSQIESPKAHPIVRECRSLILTKVYGHFQVVSRSFDRFFNYGEIEEQEPFDITQGHCYEKVDGSLIKIYQFENQWHISTKGTAFGESPVGAFDITFQQLVLRALSFESMSDFNTACYKHLHPEFTYIFEITSRENRVVKRYFNDRLWFLAARDRSGIYGSVDHKERVLKIGASIPQSFVFDSMEHCLQASHGMKDLDEGYVVYNSSGVPIYKIKSPVYLAVHRIRGEGVLTPKRIMQLILINEQDEYLNYFPEDKEFFEPYLFSFYGMLNAIELVWSGTKDIENQKEFALRVKDFPFSACLFQARSRGEDPIHVFHNQKETYKMNCLQVYKNRYSSLG